LFAVETTRQLSALPCPSIGQ